MIEPNDRTAENADWSRLDQVMSEAGVSILHFSRLIGTVGEKIYRIKRGQARITPELAEKVNAVYPKYAVEWLVSGRK